MNSNQTQKSSGSKEAADKKASSVLTISVVVGVLFILLVAVSSYYGLIRF
ncbi:MAG: hypothetical protein KME29_14420 [Calothrix sp. FI2-JRJ7]|jgi:CHASE3 domain sensor protein|nr:hypothetical protein [Calothrix sp. FI2-JRJ7]